jgi:P-type Ca2+ transporter type 2C
MIEKINSGLDIEWHKLDFNQILKKFNTNINTGLSDLKIKEARKKYGQNVLNEQKSRNFFEIFISQFKSPLIYVLLVATVIVFLLRDYVDGFIIFSIVIINSLIGAFQEGKAQNTLAALRKIVKSYATVIRNGEQKRIPDYELVPGDILILKDGDAVTADARLIETNALKVNESALTGESALILKHPDSILGLNIANSDQKNMVFRGTHITSGLGKAIVVRTGLNTIIGRIASKLSEIHITIPLKKNIDNLSKILVITVLSIAIFLFVLGINTGKSFQEMFVTVVALSVSSIPEGLPVVVTLVLAMGVWRMSKLKVLVKKLQAVEALGQANIIALDKTGTITKNQMTLQKIFINNRYFDVTGIGYKPEGNVLENDKEINPEKDIDLDLALKTSVFTSIASIVYSKADNDWILEHGDPTEAALVVLGKKLGYEKDQLLRDNPQVLEIPFELDTKHHTTINLIDNKHFLSSAGSPEILLEKCTNIWSNGVVKKITQDDIAKTEEVMREFSAEGYRLLALACDFTPNKNVTAKNLSALTFLGIVAIMDAIRTEVFDAVKTVKSANIKPVMITGDHVDTAIAISKRVGIYEDGDVAITGKEILEMSDQDVLNVLDKVSVFARVSPEDKMRIIELYKKSGKTIAMTGDGINDALSLTAADLGVAMGKVGTEVAKEASDIILLDDNFGNIVEAAEEGRNIYLTIRKAVLYLLATNLGEILVITVAIVAGLPLPIIATQIIWLNLVTDASLVVMLAFDPKEKNLLKERFKKPSKFIVDLDMLVKMSLVSFLMLTTTMFVFSQYLGQDMIKVWTICLTMLTVIKWYHIFNVRSSKKSIFSKELFNNKFLLLGLIVAVSLHLLAVYTPLMQGILKLTALNINDWILVLTLGLSVIVVEEFRKWVYRKTEKPHIV